MISYVVKRKLLKLEVILCMQFWSVFQSWPTYLVPVTSWSTDLVPLQSWPKDLVPVNVQQGKYCNERVDGGDPQKLASFVLLILTYACSLQSRSTSMHYRGTLPHASDISGTPGNKHGEETFGFQIGLYSKSRNSGLVTKLLEAFV
jgi:hypothetical protein